MILLREVTLESGIKLCGFFQGFLRGDRVPLLPQGDAQVIVGLSIMGVQFYRRLESLNRSVSRQSHFCKRMEEV